MNNASELLSCPRLIYKVIRVNPRIDSHFGVAEINKNFFSVYLYNVEDGVLDTPILKWSTTDRYTALAAYQAIVKSAMEVDRIFKKV